VTPTSRIRKMRPLEGDPSRTDRARRNDLTRAAIRDLKVDLRVPTHFSYRGFYVTRSFSTATWYISRDGTPITTAPSAAEARRVIDTLAREA